MEQLTRPLSLIVAACFLHCSGEGAAPDAGRDGGADADVAADADDDPPPVTALDETVRIEAGDVVLIHVAPAGSLSLEGVRDPRGELTGAAADAVDRSPEWLAEDLARALADLSTEASEAFAAEVLDADPRWVDEIAWCVAVTDPAVLEWMVEHDSVDIFTENAAAIYALEGRLRYADIVDLDDGRTTLELVGADGLYQLEPERYYWFVVYPRAYLELPAWHGGVFWRNFFQEDRSYTYHVIDYVSDAETVAEAVEDVGEWVQSFMSFGYATNAIWPVVIYRGQYGSCGEYSILTTAAARTALIPTISVSARADDHEWNEFWDGRWIMWDNSLGEIGTNPHHPYIDWPHIYDDDRASGSGVFGEIAHVFRFRSDEYVWPSDLYTDSYPVEVTVTDAAGRPVEGARVLAHSAESGFALCAVTSTDADGVAAFELGDDLDYGFSAQHARLGDLPRTGGVRSSVRTDDGDDLSYAMAYEGALPDLVEDLGAPPAGDRRLTLSFLVTSTEQRVVNPITTGWELGHTYPLVREGGVVDVLLIDEAGRDALLRGEPVTAHVLLRSVGEGEIDLDVPSGSDRYLILDNRTCPTCRREVRLSAEVSTR